MQKLPAGTKLSVFNQSLLTSCGISNLDSLLGGGLTIGSVLLVHADQSGTYADTLCRYFASEGVQQDHLLITYDGLVLMKTTEVKEVTQMVSDEKMKIAWRYQGIQTSSGKTTTKSSYCHTFDLQSKINDYQTSVIGGSSYDEVYEKVKLVLESKHSTNNNIKLPDRQILRITVKLSPYIEGDGRIFLLKLRSLLRFSFAVCVVVSDSAKLELSESQKCQLDLFADASIDLFSYYDHDKSYFAKEYHGSLEVRKVCTLNSQVPAKSMLPKAKVTGSVALESNQTNSSKFLFKCRRRKFCLETMHLPPEIGSSQSQQSKDW